MRELIVNPLPEILYKLPESGAYTDLIKRYHPTAVTDLLSLRDHLKLLIEIIMKRREFRSREEILDELKEALIIEERKIKAPILCYRTLVYPVSRILLPVDYATQWNKQFPAKMELETENTEENTSESQYYQLLKAED